MGNDLSFSGEVFSTVFQKIEEKSCSVVLELIVKHVGMLFSIHAEWSKLSVRCKAPDP